MTRNLFLFVVLAIAALFLVNTTVFQVDQTEQAIVLKFGNFQRTIEAPGLALKLPWENVQRKSS